MADRAGAGSSTSLRGMRERMVAAAHAIAEERRSQSGFSSFPSQSSNIRSAFKPVIDGSVLKNDMKQRLAKERREEKKRQQDANKEMQLLEKERKSKIQYEKQMEEKQRKLREQKEKDEQRRISAEEKRKQKLQEEREKFRAVLYRTLERSNRVDHRQKRWSWEGPMTVNSESKTANRRSISTEKLEQETSGLHKQMSTSSAGLQNSVVKKKTEKRRSSSLNRRDSKVNSSTETEQVEEKPVARQLYTNVRENNLITRLLAPTKASIARSKSAASLSIPGKDTPGVHNALIQYIHVPLHSHSSDELKNTIVLPKLTGATPSQENVETPSEVSLEAPPKASVEVFPKTSLEAAPKVSVEAPLDVSTGTPPEASVEAPPKASMEATSEASMEASPEASVEASPESVESPEVSLESPEVSVDSSLEVSVDPSPEVSMDSSLEVSVEVSSEASVEASPEASVEVSPKTSVEALPKLSMGMSSEASVDGSPEASVEALPKASMEASSEASMEALPKTSMEVSPEASVDASPEANVESVQKSQVDKQASNSVTKKRPSSHVLCYRRSSPASGLHPLSPVSANRQVQKNRPPSPSLMSKQSGQSSPSSKIIPVQRNLIAQNALNTTGRKREAISKTTNSSEAISQKHMTYEESGNKSTPGTMNAEEATKILAEKRRLAREQREKEEERLQKEMEQRKVKDVAKTAVEGQEEEFSKSKDGQPQKEIKKKKGCQDQDQEVLLQKGDAKIKAQEEADKRKKEHERIMLQNMQERLERKKRIEEIMKRTRKTDSNASKAAETSGNDMYEEDEADDEDESESDEDSSEDVNPSDFINGMDSSTKLKTRFKNVKKTPKLVFLDATSGQVHQETKTCFNGDMKTFGQKNVQDPLTQEKGTRLSTKRMTSRATKTGKAKETSNTVGPSRSLHLPAQEWVGEKIDIVSMAEPLMSSIPPDSEKHHLKGSMTFHQSPQTPLDSKKRNKSVSAPSDK
ncbi:PREDICTED: MAP7 domain-containing protein 3 [Ceratotherium simum simum]|uniref:MAP7 domain-containing protein 3 n=1 Tax=Ceratotherium simum simum TaxID=73337 RepID=A0ABM1DIQ6_CERSS|nr:PREDICTED: MAP7 domain-containing protein 3 [Ceratotherium simum simum]